MSKITKTAAVIIKVVRGIFAPHELIRVEVKVALDVPGSYVAPGIFAEAGVPAEAVEIQGRKGKFLRPVALPAGTPAKVVFIDANLNWAAFPAAPYAGLIEAALADRGVLDSTPATPQILADEAALAAIARGRKAAHAAAIKDAQWGNDDGDGSHFGGVGYGAH